MILLGRIECRSIRTSKTGYKSKLLALWAIKIESLQCLLVTYAQNCSAASSPEKTSSLFPQVVWHGGLTYSPFWVFEHFMHRFPQLEQVTPSLSSSSSHLWQVVCRTAKLTLCCCRPHEGSLQCWHSLQSKHRCSSLTQWLHWMRDGLNPCSHWYMSSWRVSKS